jgi:E3 ubiquitin-protein ligase RNF5
VETSENAPASSRNVSTKNPGSESSSSTSAPSAGQHDNANNGAQFECNICLDMAEEPVITLCGHLFCWKCIYEWMRPRNPTNTPADLEQAECPCPVCKSLVNRSRLIPLYGRGQSRSSTGDPRDRIPDRPSGQRRETDPAAGGHARGWEDNFAPFRMHGVQFGAGIFPFSGFGFQFVGLCGWGGGGGGGPVGGSGVAGQCEPHSAGHWRLAVQDRAL